MESRIIQLDLADWGQARSRPEWTAAVEDGKVLFFPRLAFEVLPAEQPLLREDMLAPKSRNVSLGADGVLIKPFREPQLIAQLDHVGLARRVA